MKPMSNSRPEPAAAAGLRRASRRHRVRLRRRDRAGDARRAGRRTSSSARAAKRRRTARPSSASPKRGTRRALLGASIEFVELDGDAHLEIRAAHAIKLAGVIRRVRPGIVLAPSLVENQHPDHARLGRLVRDAARLARYGGVAGAARVAAARDRAVPVLRADAGSRAARHDAGAHRRLRAGDRRGLDRRDGGARVADAAPATTSSCSSRGRGSTGCGAGVEHAIALFPNDPLVVDSLARLGRGARRF